MADHTQLAPGDDASEGAEAPEKLCIEITPDGFRVYEDEGAEAQDGDEGQEPEPGDTDDIDQTVQSPHDVLALVTQWLQKEAQEPADDQQAAQGAPAQAQPAAMKAAWNREAASRGPSGFRQ